MVGDDHHETAASCACEIVWRFWESGDKYQNINLVSTATRHHSWKYQECYIFDVEKES